MEFAIKLIATPDPVASDSPTRLPMTPDAPDDGSIRKQGHTQPRGWIGLKARRPSDYARIPATAGEFWPTRGATNGAHLSTQTRTVSSPARCHQSSFEKISISMGPS